MYSLEQLRRAVEDPDLALREVNQLYHTRLGTRSANPKGIDVIDADWDNLLILDACRYDMFERQHTLPGRLESQISKGSHTSEFLSANFAGRDLLDTVYVTASPMYYRNRNRLSATFHDVVNVWDDKGWHEEFRTVVPKTVVEFATEAAERYPKKRLIVHFLQPHYPFIGPTGREHFDLDKLNFAWDAARRGTIGVSDSLLWDAFRENLDIALPHVETLLAELGGKSVVTADHGQMIGERAAPIPMIEYGHPSGLYTDQLIRVPWLVSQNGPRREITADEPINATDNIEDTQVRERLARLGYVEA